MTAIIIVYYNKALQTTPPQPSNPSQREEGNECSTSSGNGILSLLAYSLSFFSTLSQLPPFPVHHSREHLQHRYFNRYLIIGNDNKYCQKCIGRLNSPCCQKSCSVAASLLCNIFLHHLASVVAKKSPWPGWMLANYQRVLAQSCYFGVKVTLGPLRDPSHWKSSDPVLMSE